MLTVARCRVQRGALSTLRFVAGYATAGLNAAFAFHIHTSARARRVVVPAAAELHACWSRRMLTSLRPIVSASGVWPNISLNRTVSGGRPSAPAGTAG